MAKHRGGISALSVLVVAVLTVFLSFLVLPGAQAKPDKPEKTPDQTLNDHPSGKDRTAEPGKSGTQGKSQSDPDGMANGGADKPGMTGGYDTDRDGNNGCGNDDDFEDDNNGWCGHHPKKTAVEGVTAHRDTTEVAEVSGSTAVAPAAGASVLGEVFTRSAVAPTPAAVSGGTLAATGSHIGTMASTGLLLIALGFGLVVAAAVTDRRRLAEARLRARR